jgi:hypothetical protein
MGTAPHPGWINPPLQTINPKGTTRPLKPVGELLTGLSWRHLGLSIAQPDFLRENPALSLWQIAIPAAGQALGQTL